MINYLKNYAREDCYRADGDSGKILEAAFRDEAKGWLEQWRRVMPCPEKKSST